MPKVAVLSRAIRASFSSTGSGFQSETGPGFALCMWVIAFAPNRSCCTPTSRRWNIAS